MEKNCNIRIKKLCVDGGATKNNYLMQFQADVLNKSISRTECFESTALGVAFLAGLNVCKGIVTYKAVADVFGQKYVSPNELL